jgi:hypothetical protein
MFQDLDSTLTQLLDDGSAPAEIRTADKSFETPDKDYAPTQNTVNLFLFEVGENRELRQPDMIIERQGDTYIRRKAPLRASCSYMVTTWASGVGPKMVGSEHQLLGETFEWLSMFQVIPDTYLQGSLVGQPYAPPTIAAQLDGNKVFGEFWTALGQPPRPAFLLTVTIAMDVNPRTNVPPVRTKQMNFIAPSAQAEVLNAIGGRVYAVDATTGAEIAITGAILVLPDLAVQQTTDADGLFEFPRLPGGTHTFQCVASGYQPVIRSINVPGVPGAYDVLLVSL